MNTEANNAEDNKVEEFSGWGLIGSGAVIMWIAFWLDSGPHRFKAPIIIIAIYELMGPTAFIGALLLIGATMIGIGTKQVAVKRYSTMYPGFWKRVLATSIDILIWTFGSIILYVVLLSGLSDLPVSQDQLLDGLLNSIMLPTAIAYWLYCAVLESSEHQSTFGKRLLKMKVVDSEGGRISFGKATLRHLSKALSMATFYLGFIMVAFTPHRQGLHDKIANTYVAKTQK